MTNPPYPTELRSDGYPVNWPEIKDLVREQAGHRCVCCGHPYKVGEHGNGEWSECDGHCFHDGPYRYKTNRNQWWHVEASDLMAISAGASAMTGPTEAHWRILTVHHLDGDKANCRWWNLAALCQRCHLTIQGRVNMAQVYPFEHEEWFKPYAAGYYAWTYLDQEITREEAEDRIDELLALERMA